MASWHQSKNPGAIRALWTPSPINWKCISDKPGEFASCMTFPLLMLPAALMYCERTGSTLLAPGVPPMLAYCDRLETTTRGK